jgi:predicted Fe-S protein YdhL (DUF1289 family)
MSSLHRPISSPCVKVCVLDQVTGFCTGCKRTLREIAAWGSMGEDVRQRIMGELEDRSLPGQPGPAA